MAEDSAQSDQSARTSLDTWFERLVANRMDGPAMAVAGLAIGSFVLFTAKLLSDDFLPIVQWIGAGIMAVSGAALGIVIFCFCAAWGIEKIRHSLRTTSPEHHTQGHLSSSSSANRPDAQFTAAQTEKLS